MGDFSWDQYWWTQRCFVPLVGYELDVSIYPEDHDAAPPTARQLEVFESASALPPSLRDSLDDAAERYRKEIDEEVGLTWPEVAGINRSNIRAHYRIDQIFVPRLQSCSRSYLFLDGECDWEEEHGLEILLRDGHVLLCGEQGGLMQNQEWNKYLT